MPPKLPSLQGFGESLRRLRKERGLTMGDVADRSGLDLVTVSDLERGLCRSRVALTPYLAGLGLNGKLYDVLSAAGAVAFDAERCK